MAAGLIKVSAYLNVLYIVFTLANICKLINIDYFYISIGFVLITIFTITVNYVKRKSDSF